MQVERAVEVAAGEHEADLPAAHLLALVQERRERRRAGALGDVVGVAEVVAHGREDVVVRDRDDALDALEDDLERTLVGHPDREAVGEGLGRFGRDRPLGLERQRVGRGLFRHHADQLGREAQCLARGDRAADARAEADRHVERVEIGHGAQQLEAVRGHPAHQEGMERAQHAQAAVLGQLGGELVGRLEVVAVLDEFGAERHHRQVLLDAVAARHHDHRPYAEDARGEGDALAVVAAGRGDHAGQVRLRLLEVAHVDQPAAHLEGADRGVVLVLDPDLAAAALGQQRPADLRRRRDRAMHEIGGGLELGEGGHGGTPP